LDTLVADVRHALRRLRRSPGFTTVAVLTLALGIGANATVFSALDALLVEPLPYPDPGTLVAVSQTDPRTGTVAVAPGSFADWRERSSSFSYLAAWELVGRSLVLGDKPRRVGACISSGNLFDLLGVPPALGETFHAAASEGPREVVLGYALWRDRFSSDPSVVGRDVRLDDELVRIRGVMPREFAFPREAELWLRADRDLPEVPVPGIGDLRQLRDARYLAVLGRLKQDVGLEAARREMDVVAAQLARDFPVANEGMGARVTPLFEELRGAARPTLRLLLATVGLVLLVACANVANLLLARTVGRRQELALRAALGASRGRLVGQLLTEAATLVLLGTGAGLLLARAGHALLVAYWPADLPPLDALRLSPFVLASVAGLAALAVIVVGVLPARLAGREDALSTMRSAGRAPSAPPSAHRTRGAFVVAEIALAALLVSGAGLLAGSLRRLYAAPLGFEPEGVLTARVSLPRGTGSDLAAARLFFAEAERRLAVLPGVEGAGFGQALPLTGRRVSASLRVEGRPDAEKAIPAACWRVVTPSYLSVLGVGVVRGRGFDAHDDTTGPAVALVNAALAQRAWPDQDPIGKRLATDLDGEGGAWVTVVGVVADTPQESVTTAARPEMYRPLAQDQKFGAGVLSAAVRTSGKPIALAAPLERALAEVRSDVTVSDVKPLERLRADAVAGPRAAAQVLGLTSLLALFLAALGLYGVLSCVVGERRHELGVRLSLGARPGTLVALVVKQSAVLAGTGLALGLAGAVASSRLLEGWLFGVSPHDPWTMAAAAAVLMLTALLAGYAPARRASRLDPAALLRSE
jgi:putative ABC transport system permease protein